MGLKGKGHVGPRGKENLKPNMSKSGSYGPAQKMKETYVAKPTQTVGPVRKGSEKPTSQRENRVIVGNVDQLNEA